MGSARVSQEADPIVTSRPSRPGIAGFPFEARRSVCLKTPERSSPTLRSCDYSLWASWGLFDKDSFQQSQGTQMISIVVSDQECLAQNCLTVPMLNFCE